MAAINLPNNNLTFVHIPKSAGSSVVEWLSRNFEYERIGGHPNLSMIKKSWNVGRSFAIVRNPWARMVSSYFYLQQYKFYWEYNNRINELMKLYQQWIKANPLANVCDILKMIQSFNCFYESAIFLPGQEYVDVNLGFTDNSGIKSDLPNGLYKYEDERIPSDNTASSVSGIINQHMNEDINIYFVSCCRMCDSDISDTFTERIYIYEFFFGLFNSFVIDNLSFGSEWKYEMKTTHWKTSGTLISVNR